MRALVMIVLTGCATEIPERSPAERYLATLAPVLAGRVLRPDERELATREGDGAVLPILERWSSEPGFAVGARTFVELRAGVSGTRDGIDFDLAGNLVEHVVRANEPWGAILTSESCWSREGEAIECDSGAPFSAGVLTTRGFLAAHAGRYNLPRASKTLDAFVCRSYPIEDTLEPRADREELLPLFRANSAAEQTDPAAAGGRNGAACYGCHGQFALHSQLFVRFDDLGRYVPDATGLQSPTGQPGESTDGLMASHMVDPARASSESSRWFGTPVANLAEAARVLAGHRAFAECTTRSLLAYGLKLDRGAPVDDALVASMTDAALARSAAPTYRDFVVSVFADVRVIDEVEFQLEEP